MLPAFLPGGFSRFAAPRPCSRSFSCVLDVLEELICVNDSRKRVDGAHEVKVFSEVARVAGLYRFAESQAHIHRGHIVFSREIVDVRDCREAAGIYFGDAGLPVSALLDIEEKNPRGLRIERPNGLCTDLDNAWFKGGLRQGRRRRHAAWTAAVDVRQALGHLGEDKRALVPQALHAEIAARQIFGKRERPRRNPAHLLPVSDPAPDLLRALDRNRAERAGASANSAPQTGTGGEAAKQFPDSVQGGYRIGQGRRNAAAAQKHRQGVLVLAPLDHRFPGQKGPTGETIAQPGNCQNIGIVGRDQKIDALRFDDLAQGAPEFALRRKRNEIVAIGGRFLENEPIVMAADDEERRVSHLQAVDQIVACTRSGTEDKQSPDQSAPLPPTTRLAVLFARGGLSAMDFVETFRSYSMDLKYVSARKPIFLPISSPARIEPRESVPPLSCPEGHSSA